MIYNFFSLEYQCPEAARRLKTHLRQQKNMSFVIFLLKEWMKTLFLNLSRMKCVLKYHPFHKTLPRSSSAFVNWISVRVYWNGHNVHNSTVVGRGGVVYGGLSYYFSRIQHFPYSKRCSSNNRSKVKYQKHV